MNLSSHPLRKRFGQNFLQDKNILQKMQFNIQPSINDHIVEIGPGLGALTAFIQPHCQRFDAIEIDRDLIEKLSLLFSKAKQFYLHQADALKFDFARIIQSNKKIRVIGNLPYNISTPLIFHVLDYATQIQDCYFLLQKEVVDRLCAKPGNKDYGRLSVMTQYRCQTQSLFIVSPDAFFPKPKVTSAFVRVIPYDTLPSVANDFQTLQNVVRQVFSQRRKTIRNTLKKFLSSEQLIALNLNPLSRPEELSVAEFVSISNAIKLESGNYF